MCIDITESAEVKLIFNTFLLPPSIACTIINASKSCGIAAERDAIISFRRQTHMMPRVRESVATNAQ